MTVIPKLLLRLGFNYTKNPVDTQILMNCRTPFRPTREPVMPYARSREGVSFSGPSILLPTTHGQDSFPLSH